MHNCEHYARIPKEGKPGLELHLYLYSSVISVYCLLDLRMSNYTRSQFRVQSLEEFLNADAPLLSWEEIQQKLLLSPDDRPSMRESTASEGIDSLLSASSYPLPEPLVPQGSSQHQEAPLYGGFFIETPSSQGEVNRTTGLRSTPESTQELPHSESSSASSLPRKRGRPRKNAADLLDEDPEEVCVLSRVGIRLNVLRLLLNNTASSVTNTTGAESLPLTTGKEPSTL